MARARLSAVNEENDHLFETFNGATTVLHETSRHLQMTNLTVLAAISTISYKFPDCERWRHHLTRSANFDKSKEVHKHINGGAIA